MNVYDNAHSLARAIKDSNEYLTYKSMKDEVSKNAELSEMLNDFQQKQYSLQAQQLLGQDISPDIMEQVQELMQIIMRDPKAAEYMQAEMMFSKMIADVYGILGEVIKFNHE
ncbi:MAG: YlbF family regulator [Eubacteriales bacterium]